MNPNDVGQPQVDPSSIIEQMGMDNQMLQQRNMDMANALSSQAFNDQEEQNLIHFQLETDKILERIEHFLKGDQIKFDKEKGQYFSSPTKNVLCTIKKDPKTNFLYYFSEIKEKGDEKPKEIIVRIVNPKGEEVNIGVAESKIIASKLSYFTLFNSVYKYAEI